MAKKSARPGVILLGTLALALCLPLRRASGATAEGGLTNLHSCLRLYQAADTSAEVRQAAAEELWRALQEGALLPSKVMRELPEKFDPQPETRLELALLLADACQNEGQRTAASGLLEQLLRRGDLAPEQQARLRQHYAALLEEGGAFQEACEVYEKIAGDRSLPPFTRAIAQLGVGRALADGGQDGEAARAFKVLAEMDGAPPHLVAEGQRAAELCSTGGSLKAGELEAERTRMPLLPESELRFFIAPDGHDGNRGSIDEPLATLERARDLLRMRRGQLPPGGATVYLRGGRYPIDQTFELTSLDSGRVGAPIIYRAWRDEKPVLDGGVPVKGFGRIRDRMVLSRLSPQARGKVLVADLRSQGLGDFPPQRSYGFGISNKSVLQLYDGERPLICARWPNEGDVKIAQVVNASNHTFSVASERFTRWRWASDLMAHGYWQHLWASCAVPATVISFESGTVALLEPPGQYTPKAGNPCYFFNLLEELDQPGEWYLDRAGGLLYLWPERRIWQSNLIISRLDKPFIRATKVSELYIHGLTIEYGQQHGVVLNGCFNSVLSGCTIRHLGGNGLVTVGCANVKVYGNLLHTLGHGGMIVGGGNRQQLLPGRMLVENNEVFDVGRCARTYSPALLLAGCGGRAAFNTFHRNPSSALRVEGNDFTVAYNDIYDVLLESDDQGALDMWGDPSYRGNVIRHNRWRRLGAGAAPCGRAAIRLDDAISGTLVYGNCFEDCSVGNFGAVQIHGGHFNTIDANLFLSSRYGISFSSWGAAKWEEYLKKVETRRMIYSAVNTRLPLYRLRYPELLELQKQPDANNIWRNLFVAVERPLYDRPAAASRWGNRYYAKRAQATALWRYCGFNEKEAGVYRDIHRVESVAKP